MQYQLLSVQLSSCVGKAVRSVVRSPLYSKDLQYDVPASHPLREKEQAIGTDRHAVFSYTRKCPLKQMVLRRRRYNARGPERNSGRYYSKFWHL